MAEGEQQQVPQQTNARSIFNAAVDPSILKYRLDTSKTLDSIQVYLEGRTFYRDVDKDGNPYIAENRMSEPKANQEGIHSIMNFLRSTISSPVVQGNFVDTGRYDRWVYEAHGAITFMLAVNADDWAIRDEDLEPINDTIMLLLQAFASRLLFNKERDGYSATMQTQETVVQQQRGGSLLGMFRRGK